MILVSAGEPSGDALAAPVVRRLLRSMPRVKIYGAGGDRMAAAGAEIGHHVDRLAVTGLSEAAGRAGASGRLLVDLVWRAARGGADLALLVDYPGLNMRLAAALRRLGVPVLYYVAPQRWAWLGWRTGALRRHVDRLAVTLPFEEAWFRARGVRATFVGHPVLETPPPPPREEARACLGVQGGAQVIALLPGSREHEVRRHLPLMLAATQFMGPEVVPVIATLPGSHDALCRSLEPGTRRAPAATVLGAADIALCASGSATLELALAGVPAVVTYRMSPLSHAVARRLVRVPWISLPNLILNRGLLPELIQDEATPETLAAAAHRLLQPTEAAQIREGLAKVKKKLGTPGASRRVAEMAQKLIKQGTNRS